MINIAIRFDDPSITSNHALEEAVISICIQYGVKINFAVIPYRNIEHKLTPITPLAAKHLVDAQERELVEISQHGYSHQNRAPADQFPSEFKNCCLEEQIDLLDAGKKLLDDIFLPKNRGFVPPWNSFDKNTLIAASKLNFNFISAGWVLPLDYRRVKTKILPRTAQVSNLITHIQKYRAYARLSPVIIAVIHHYDFIESNDKNAKFDLMGFEQIIKYITASKHVRITSLDSIANNLNSKNTFFAHSTHKLLSNNLNWRLQKLLPTPLFFHNSLKRKP